MLVLQKALRSSENDSSLLSHHQSHSQDLVMHPFGGFNHPISRTTNGPGGHYNPNTLSYNNNTRRHGPQSAATRLPEGVLLRLLSHCDEITLLDSALVSRYWLILSRRVYFANFTISCYSDFRLLLNFLQQPLSTVHAGYVTRLDVSFTSDDPSPGAALGYNTRRSTSHITATDVHQLLLHLGAVESIRADWIGTRGSSSRGASPADQRSQMIPTFLSLPHVLQNVRHLEIRGGSWPFDSFLKTIFFMAKLTSLSLENIHEPGNIVSALPQVTPKFQLQRLSLGRCTLSGESMGWLLSSSRQTLRHLVINSIRRRSGSTSFTTVLSMVGQALETLRVRNYVELTRWDPESLVNAGLAFCPNLKTLVIWCDVPQSNGLGSSSSGIGRSPAFGTSHFSPSPGTSSPQFSYLQAGPATLGLTSNNRSRNSSIVSRPPTVSSPHRQTPHLGSPSLGYHGELGLAFPSDPTSSPLGPLVSSPPSPSALLTAVPPSPGSMLPTLVTVIEQGWLPRLRRLVIPPTQIEMCPSLVDYQAKLIFRGVALDGDWGLA